MDVDMMAVMCIVWQATDSHEEIAGEEGEAVDGQGGKCPSPPPCILIL